MAARSLPGGPNLGLTKVEVWWQGYGGLGLVQLRGKLKTLLKVADKPEFAIVHCGGNDIGKVPCKMLRKHVQVVFDLFCELMPETKVIWSEVLPRSSWRYSSDNEAMERARKRLNSFAGKLAITRGGAYLRHTQLCRDWHTFECSDGVHLSNEGNVVFLNQIKKGIVQFKLGKQYIV